MASETTPTNLYIVCTPLELLIIHYFVVFNRTLFANASCRLTNSILKFHRDCFTQILFDR